VTRSSRSALPGFRFTLFLAAAFAAWPAWAGDVSVKLDSGTGFSIKESTGSVERLRVDESTGNVSRNGALFVHTTGSSSSLFVGDRSGNALMTGGANTGFGVGPLNANTTGRANSAFGNVALGHNTTGSLNSAFGRYALFANTTGGRSTAVGAYALGLNRTGSFNSAVGYLALFYNDAGSSNSAFGAYAIHDNSTGYDNSAVGFEALRKNTTGRRNVAVGRFAGGNQTTGSDNIYLANTGVAAESATIRVGCPAGLCASGATPHTSAFIAGIRGTTTSNADAIPVLIDSAGQLGTVSSSRSVKKDIHDMGDATARLLDLRPVTFRYKQEQTLPDGREVPPEYGLVAEEVAEVFPDLVVYDEKGQPFTVKYHEMAPMLLNEMKKQQRTIEAQRLENQAQQQEIAALTARLSRLEAYTRQGTRDAIPTEKP
jgi:hypothetical protein